MGDFNCHIGTMIKGNTKLTTSGKQLIQLTRKHKLTILNTTKECKGKWTREQNENKSIIDYGIVKKKNERDTKEVIIDEEKNMAPYKITKEGNEFRKTYSDHNAILKITVDWITN